MSELEVINRTENGPITQFTIQDDLARLGVKPGMVILVHSSLSAMGWVCGGSVAVILAFQKILGPNGTLVMPTHSTKQQENGWMHREN